MKSSFFLCLASIIALSGCASAGYPTTYNSLPQGATLVCGNAVMGVTPYTGYRSAANLEELATQKRFEEQVYEEARATGASENAINIVKARQAALGCRAVWASGATALYDYVDANTAKAHPNGIVLLVNHPGDANTRAIDDARSLQARQLQLQQQQVQLQQQQQVQLQQPTPAFQPQPLPAMPATSFPSAPGRTTTVCRTLSNGTVVCD